MTLTLSVLRCPDAAPPETRNLEGGEFRIGRGPDNDWVLTDPERVLSKRHCVIAWRSGAWQIADTSTNGTYINQDLDPLGGSRVHTLEDGDRIRLGSYEIEARLQAGAGFGQGSHAGMGYGAPAGGGRGSAFDDPFGDDPFVTPAAPVGPASHDDWLSGGNSISMPDDFSGLSADDSFLSPTSADHTPSQNDAFRPAPMTPKLLPDDWDLGLEPGGGAGDGLSWAPPPTPVSPPVPPSAQMPPLPPPVAQPPLQEQPQQPPFEAPPPPPPAPTPFDEPELPPLKIVPSASAAQAPPAKPAPAVAGDLAGIFLEAAGMSEGVTPDDPAAMMRRLGGVFRALVGGLRQVMIARAEIKGEFRIEQTMIRARGNNPLKFSADDDDAMAALLGLGRRTSDMAAEEAVRDALRDIRLHELAVMSAMQAAVRAMLERLDPAPLRAEADAARAVLPAQRKARAFDAYEALYGQISRALADDFDSVFGKTFARAYERALSDAEVNQS